MKATTTTNQAECTLILDVLEIRDRITPTPPHDTCDGLLPMNGTDGLTWLLITNARGRFTIHALEDCTQAQAFDYLQQVRGGAQFCNPRLDFCGAEPQSATPTN